MKFVAIYILCFLFLAESRICDFDGRFLGETDSSRTDINRLKGLQIFNETNIANDSIIIPDSNEILNVEVLHSVNNIKSLLQGVYLRIKIHSFDFTISNQTNIDSHLNDIPEDMKDLMNNLIKEFINTNSFKYIFTINKTSGFKVEINEIPNIKMKIYYDNKDFFFNLLYGQTIMMISRENNTISVKYKYTGGIIRAYNPKFNHYIITDILSKINENSKETDSLKMLNSQNIYQFTNTDNQQVFDIIEECKEVIQMCLEGK